MVSPPVSTTAPPTPPEAKPPVISTAPPKHFWVQPPITARYSSSVTSVVPHRYVVTFGASFPKNAVARASVQHCLVHRDTDVQPRALVLLQIAVLRATCKPPDTFTTPPLPPAVLLFPPAVRVRNPPLWLSSVVSPAVSVMFPPCPVSPDHQQVDVAPVPLVPRVGLLWIRIGIVAELCITIAPDSFTCRRLSASSYPCLIRMGSGVAVSHVAQSIVAADVPSADGDSGSFPGSDLQPLLGSALPGVQRQGACRVSRDILRVQSRDLGHSHLLLDHLSCSVLICTRSVYVSWYTMLLVDTKLPWTVRSPNTSVRTVFDPLRRWHK